MVKEYLPVTVSIALYGIVIACISAFDFFYASSEWIFAGVLFAVSVAFILLRNANLRETDNEEKAKPAYVLVVGMLLCVLLVVIAHWINTIIGKLGGYMFFHHIAYVLLLLASVKLMAMAIYSWMALPSRMLGLWMLVQNGVKYIAPISKPLANSISDAAWAHVGYFNRKIMK